MKSKAARAAAEPTPDARILAAVERFEKELADTARLARLKVKEILTAEEASELGYFESAAAAATMRSKKKGPRYCRISARAIRYYRKDLEDYFDRNRIFTLQEAH